MLGHQGRSFLALKLALIAAAGSLLKDRFLVSVINYFSGMDLLPSEAIAGCSWVSHTFQVICLERAFVNARLNRQAKDLEIIKVSHADKIPDRPQALKLSPQEQLVAAFGLLTLKPPSCRVSA